MQLVADELVRHHPSDVVWRHEGEFDAKFDDRYERVDLLQGTDPARTALPTVLFDLVNEYMIGF